MPDKDDEPESNSGLTPEEYLTTLEQDVVRKRAADMVENTRRASATVIGLILGTVVYCVALYFGLFWWTLLATVVYWVLAGFIFPATLRRVGVIDRGRTDLIAAILGLFPAAALLLLPLSAVGFHPHGSWSFLCWMLSSGANCTG